MKYTVMLTTWMMYWSCTASLYADASLPAMGGGLAGLANMVPMILMFIVVYFLMIRPQQKRMKETQDMIAKLMPGQKIIMNCGIVGEVKQLQEKLVVLEVAPTVHLRMLKSQIAGLFEAL